MSVLAKNISSSKRFDESIIISLVLLGVAVEDAALKILSAVDAAAKFVVFLYIMTVNVWRKIIAKSPTNEVTLFICRRYRDRCAYPVQIFKSWYQNEKKLILKLSVLRKAAPHSANIWPSDFIIQS